MMRHSFKTMGRLVKLPIVWIILGVMLVAWWFWPRHHAEPPAPQAAAAETRGCLEGHEGTFMKAASEHVLIDKAGNWTWRTVATFQLDTGLVVTCLFDDLEYEKVWTEGMKMRSSAGQRLVGAYDDQLPKAKPSPSG